ncbi:nuclear transport factor 2 family protein [Sphingomonas sp. TX0543]|uniref:nuclear transport factor 2 family protein n=1 Tax=unclassified Sphingomonas TaxID=196159 RepID=UPI0010F9A48B|nr:nuclear transport factor 2 family protein [Sphingomonas sp. 3P27F8]
MGATITAILLAAAAPLPADLAEAVRAYDAAQVKGDRIALERLLADDYTLVNSGGAIETRAELIRDYTAPGFTLEPFTVEQPIEKVWANGAVMGGVALLRGTDSGKRYEARLRFADVWAKRDGRWQVIYTQASRVMGAK